MRKFTDVNLKASQPVIRKLLNVAVISGDGNYHLHSMIRVKNLLADPSVYGDHGFFVPYRDARHYTEWADNHGSNRKVRGSFADDQRLVLWPYSMPQDHSSCETLAGSAGRERRSDRYRIVGIWVSMCDHGMYRFRGTIDLEKGER